MEYINQNHDVNQGNALEHDFSAILEMLAFPIKNLLDSDLPMSVMKEIDASWTKLFSAFVRESALIPTIDDNQAIEEFCSRLNMMLKHGEIHLKVSERYLSFFVSISDGISLSRQSRNCVK